MALITDCRVCGERISLRKMRAGQYVAFEVGTDVQHQHTKSKKKRGKSAEPNTIENIRETNDNASDEINRPIFGSTNNQNNFSNNTSPEFCRGKKFYFFFFNTHYYNWINCLLAAEVGCQR